MNIIESSEFRLAVEDKAEQFKLEFDEEPSDMDLDFGETSNLGGTDDFDKLRNRPSYGGKEMTHETDIPAIEIDEAISGSSKNPVENRAISEAMGAKVDANDLSKVAKTGKYEDLEGEPDCFTPAEWNRLWATY